MIDVLKVDATEDSIDEINEFLKEKLEKAGCDNKSEFEIELAVEEICVNVFSYAYTGEPTEDPLWNKLEVQCEILTDPAGVTIRFIDAGEAFNPIKKKDADTSGKMFMAKEGGFGIHFVKKTMSRVEYEYRGGRNILTIQKDFGHDIDSLLI